MAVQTVKSLFNRKNKIDGLTLLNSIDTETVKVAFFDPQYRGVLDKLSYGNEGVSRGKARSSLTQMEPDTIIKFIISNIIIIKFNFKICFLKNAILFRFFITTLTTQPLIHTTAPIIDFSVVPIWLYNHNTKYVEYIDII